jgi:hypothetical protein
MLVLTVTEEVQVARNHWELLQCLYTAEAGAAFARAKLAQDPSWTGLPAPGRAVGPGRFTVVVSDSAADGTPLPGGQKRIDVKAQVHRSERRIEVILP